MTDIGMPRTLDIGRVLQETFQILGRHFVPFWRQMMLPGWAVWPPKSLIPSI